IFRQAEAVVGVHGAALTNIVFRHPETMDLFEIHSPGGSETMYAQIATRLGYRYTYLEGTNPSERGNRADFDVDVGEIASVMDRVLGSERGGDGS
ncbi:MAG: glycosyltransferase family 61 protein, partial [Gemmatimonadetes bacterium]|nr:glycosyltransferase family 61 protein [Gemmatimonadota bacterium]